MSQELVDLKKELIEYNALKREMEDMIELAGISREDPQGVVDLKQQLAGFTANMQKAEQALFLSGKYDKGNVIITITAGAGGKDSQDWATMLYRMYQRYCEGKKWRVKELSRSHGEPGPEGRVGTKQVSFEVQGRYAYGFLKREAGVHRLVRMSPFSAKALRHTSFASLEVLPIIDVAKEKDIEPRVEDLRIDMLRSSGPGGQNVNKRETAVRLIHIPTGIQASSQTQRSQQQNKEKALEILLAKLYQKKAEQKEKELAHLRGTKKSIEWGSQVRSYVLAPYQLVKDHRTNVETKNVEAVLNGELDVFIEEEIKV